MCDLAVFVNRHTLPSRSVTDDRHREDRATLNAPVRFRRSTPVVRNAMEVEPMCIVENETVSGTIFRQYVRLTMCSRVTQTCAMGKQLHGSCVRAPRGLHHIVQRGRASDGCQTRVSRVSTIAMARANCNCPDVPGCESIEIASGGEAGGTAEGRLLFS